MRKMKVLVLSCNTGEGHNSAAIAVKEAFIDAGSECEVVDALRLRSEKYSTIVSAFFNSIAVRAPAAFGMMYKAGGLFSSTKLTSPVFLANTVYAKHLYDYILEDQYDTVVCTHLFPMEALTYIRRKYPLDVKCYGVLTDYTCIPFLEETDMDAYLLPHECVVPECIKNGMPENRLIVTGLPVAKRFRSRMAKEDARKYLVMPRDKIVYLIMTGGVGCGNAQELCDEILRCNNEAIAVYVLVGRNGELKESIKKRYRYDSRIQTVTFTEKVNIYMSAADVLISKPGGISSTEAAVLNIPQVHTAAISGCEIKNAEFFSRMGMSLYAESPKQAAEYARLLAYDRDRAEKMCVSQRENINPHGAENIVNLIYNKIYEPAKCGRVVDKANDLGHGFQQSDPGKWRNNA